MQVSYGSVPVPDINLEQNASGRLNDKASHRGSGSSISWLAHDASLM
jgi:hypothetical protein